MLPHAAERRPTSAASRGSRLSLPRLPPARRVTTTRGSIVLQDDIYVRAADPNDPRTPPPDHAHVTPYAHDHPFSARRARLLDVPRDHGDARARRVRRRRLRRRERRPADVRRLQGPQVHLRGRRGGAELLRLPPQPGQRLLDEVRRRPGAERHRAQPGQPGLERLRQPTRAAGATCRTRRPVHGRAAAGRPATRRASPATRRASSTSPRAPSGCASPAGRRRRASCAAASSRPSVATASSTSSTSPTSRTWTRRPTRPRARATTAQTNCGDKSRAARAVELHGDPVHHGRRRSTARSTPTTTSSSAARRTFGRDGRPTASRSPAPPPGWKQTQQLQRHRRRSTALQGRREKLTMPPTNSDALTTATAAGIVTRARRHPFTASSTTMTVTNADRGWTNDARSTLPANGVIYVKNGRRAARASPPTDGDYAEPKTCGNLYVQGTYATSMTFGAENDIIIGSQTDTTNGNLTQVRRRGPGPDRQQLRPRLPQVNRARRQLRRNADGRDEQRHDRRRDPLAAALLHGRQLRLRQRPLGTLNVNGAIAQKYRGAVGTGTRRHRRDRLHEELQYDDRLRYRSPPYFLQPDAAWNVIRSQRADPGALARRRGSLRAPRARPAGVLASSRRDRVGLPGIVRS